MSATLPTVGPGEFRDAMRQLAGAVNVVTSQCGDLPPLKWSSLKYVFRMEDRIDGKEEAYG